MEFEIRPPARDREVPGEPNVELESPGIADSLGDGRFFLELEELEDEESSFTIDMPGILHGVVVDTKDGSRKKCLKLGKSLAFSLFVNSGIGVTMNESSKIDPVKNTSVEGVLREVEEQERDREELLENYSKKISERMRPAIEKYFEKEGEELFNQGINIEVFAALSAYERTYEKIRSGIIIDAEKAANDAEDGKKYLIQVYQKRLQELLERTSGDWTGDIKEDTLTLLREGYWSEKDINLFKAKLEYQEDAHSLEDHLLAGEANCTLSKLTPIILKDIYEHEGLIFHPAEIGAVIWRGHVETGLRVLEDSEIIEYLVQESDVTNPIKFGLTPPGAGEGTYAPSVFHIFNEMGSVDFISDDLIRLAEHSLETALETKASERESLNSGDKSRARNNFAKNSFSSTTDSGNFFLRDESGNAAQGEKHEEEQTLINARYYLSTVIDRVADDLYLSSSAGFSEGVYFLELPEIEKNDDLTTLIDFLDVNNKYFHNVLKISHWDKVSIVKILNSINFSARVLKKYDEFTPYIKVLEETLVRGVMIEEEIPSILFRAGMTSTIERNAKFIAEYLAKPENIKKIEDEITWRDTNEAGRVDFIGWEKTLEILEEALSPEDFAPLLKYKEIITNYRDDRSTDLLTNIAREYQFEKLPDISQYSDEAILDLFPRLSYRSFSMAIREIIYRRPHLIKAVHNYSNTILKNVFNRDLGLGVPGTLNTLREVSILIQSGHISEETLDRSSFEISALMNNVNAIIGDVSIFDGFRKVIITEEGVTYLKKLKKIAKSGQIDLETITIFEERHLVSLLHNGKLPALKTILRNSYFNSGNRELKKQIIGYAQPVFSEHEVEVADIEMYKKATERQQRPIKAVKKALDIYSR